MRIGHRHTSNTEWGRKARKEEDRLRGLNNRARQAAIVEATSDDETSEQPASTATDR